VVWNSAQGVDAAAERDAWLERLDATAALGVPALTVVVAGKVGDDLAAEYDAAAGKLATLTGLAVERGLRVNLEFLGGEKVCGTLGGGIDLVRRVDHPNFGLLFDLCHYQLSASHLEELADLPPGKLFLVHVDDVCRGPLEAQTTTSRGLLGEGRLDIAGLLRKIRKRTSYDGWYSIELYDPAVWEMDPELVLRHTTEAARRLDESLETT
jgi:sugar phosphate isomerase/epimerase